MEYRGCLVKSSTNIFFNELIFICHIYALLSFSPQIERDIFDIIFINSRGELIH